MVQKKSFYFCKKNPRATTAKIFQAHYFSYNFFDRLNLEFGRTLVALNLMLLRKIKIKLPITAEIF